MDSINLSDVSTPDTGKGSQLKTGGRRSNNMPSKDRCKDFAKLGYKTKSDCLNRGSKARWRKDGSIEIYSTIAREDSTSNLSPSEQKKLNKLRANKKGQTFKKKK